jgi:ABC-type bacteriocin/lantibiotic exporter with double-glycine peptidase domain
MDTLIHADIFFFISTIALVFISLGLVIAIIYLIKILRDVSEVSHKVKEESIEIIDNVKTLRTDIKREGFRFASLLSFFTAMFKKRRRSKKEKEKDG